MARVEQGRTARFVRRQFVGGADPRRLDRRAAGKVKNQFTLANDRLQARRPVALPRHADEKCSGLPGANLLHAAALQSRTGRPIVGTGTFDASQLGEHTRGWIQNLNPVSDAVGCLFQDQAQEVATGGG